MIDEITPDKQIQKSLRFSVIEGLFSGSMTGFVQDYFIPLILILGGTEKHVGILSAIPNMIGSIIQVKSPDLTEKFGSRKQLVKTFVFLQSFSILFMAYLTIIHKKSPFLFICVVIFYTSFAAIASPAWGSLLSSLIPENKRGYFLGWRNRIIGLTTVSASLLAGIILYYMKRINIFYGFFIIFCFASIFRLISGIFISKMYEPCIEYNEENNFTLYMFIRRIKESNFVQFVLFVSLLNFSVNLASPFFAVLMLKYLCFNYLLYTVIIITASIMIYLAMSRWGKHADVVGNLRVIKSTSPLIGLIPLLWIINRNPIFLIFAQMYSGFVWSGFNLSCTNFIYDAVIPEKRTRCIAYFNLFNNTALCAGALCGGFLVNRLPPIFGYKILTLFAISSFLRIIVGTILPQRLKEVRSVKHITSYNLFISMVNIRPMLGIERKTIRH